MKKSIDEQLLDLLCPEELSAPEILEENADLIEPTKRLLNKIKHLIKDSK